MRTGQAGPTGDGTNARRFGLSTLPREEYPKLPELPALRGVEDATEFAAAVAQVVIAAGRDDALPVLTGIGLRLDGESMTLAASDHYRYAVRTVPWKPEEADSDVVEVVIPGRRLTDISRSLAKSGQVRIGLSDSGGPGGGLIAFEGAGMRTTLRLLEGRLPRYDKLFALDSPAVAVTEREALADAVRRVAVVAEPNSPIRLDFSAQGTVLLQAGYEDDIASQQLPATLSGAPDMAVALNPAYLLEALNSLSDSQVRFDLLGPGQRALLSGASAADDVAREEHRHLLMSVRQLS
ncbi:DNA polymerase III subunit beta [Streptomyces sp. NPDC058246]|uniref:DNA polymerase III subunit beta n=1 Tax=Streptomyces sp. NPDC058246 TaxID=3346400 RepID=UPI0036E2DAD7